MKKWFKRFTKSGAFQAFVMGLSFAWGFDALAKGRYISAVLQFVVFIGTFILYSYISKLYHDDYDNLVHTRTLALDLLSRRIPETPVTPEVECPKVEKEVEKEHSPYRHIEPEEK